jgi:hypothetical protein
MFCRSEAPEVPSSHLTTSGSDKFSKSDADKKDTLHGDTKWFEARLRISMSWAKVESMMLSGDEENETRRLGQRRKWDGNGNRGR